MLCDYDIPIINIFNQHPELIPFVKDIHVYNVVMCLNKHQDFTYYQLNRLLLSSSNIEEVRGINQVYSVISSMVLDLEIQQILTDLDCPQNAIKIIKTAVIAGIEDFEALKHITNRIYPNIEKTLFIRSASISAHLRNAIETMYQYNSTYIIELCGDYIPTKSGTPTSKVFLQAFTKNIKDKKKSFENEMRYMLGGIHIIGRK